MERIIIGAQRIYGTKIKGEITPLDFWNFCVQNRIPYIIVRPKVKYSFVSYDLLSIDKGLTFDSENNFSEVWEQVYFDYILKSALPKNKMYFIGGGKYGEILIFKKDQNEIITLLFQKIEDHIKQYGKFSLENKKYYEYNAERNKIAEATDRYFESMNKKIRKQF